MKRIIAITLVSLLALGATAQNKVKTYLIKSGHVKYELSGTTAGSHELWWDNYGDWQREEKNITTTTKVMGFKSVNKEHTVIITKGKMIWTADLEENTGSLGVNPMYDMIQAQYGNMSDAEQEAAGNRMIEGIGGKKEGTGKVLGYTCDIVKAMGSKMWTYKNVPLKRESNIMGIKSGEIATSFTPNAKVSTSKFEPLANISYTKDPSVEAILSEGESEDEASSQEIVPLSYPYAKFAAKMNAYNPSGYRRMGPMQMMGTYSCIWMVSENNMMAVSAASSENNKEVDMNSLPHTKGIEKFTHKGHTCYYGMPEDEETSQADEEATPVLIVYYKSEKMILVLVKQPDSSKQSLLNFYDKIAL